MNTTATKAMTQSNDGDSRARSIVLTCGTCGRRLTVPAHLAGATGRCPNCLGNVRVPAISKVCCACGVDVAQQRRVKDDTGRYYCHPCWSERTVDGYQAMGDDHRATDQRGGMTAAPPVVACARCSELFEAPPGQTKCPTCQSKTDADAPHSHGARFPGVLRDPDASCDTSVVGHAALDAGRSPRMADDAASPSEVPPGGSASAAPAPRGDVQVPMPSPSSAPRTSWGAMAAQLDQATSQLPERSRRSDRSRGLNLTPATEPTDAQATPDSTGRLGRLLASRRARTIATSVIAVAVLYGAYAAFLKPSAWESEQQDQILQARVEAQGLEASDPVNAYLKYDAIHRAAVGRSIRKSDVREALAQVKDARTRLYVQYRPAIDKARLAN